MVSLALTEYNLASLETIDYLSLTRQCIYSLKQLLQGSSTIDDSLRSVLFEKKLPQRHRLVHCVGAGFLTMQRMSANSLVLLEESFSRLGTIAHVYPEAPLLPLPFELGILLELLPENLGKSVQRFEKFPRKLAGGLSLLNTTLLCKLLLPFLMCVGCYYSLELLHDRYNLDVVRAIDVIVEMRRVNIGGYTDFIIFLQKCKVFFVQKGTGPMPPLEDLVQEIRNIELSVDTLLLANETLLLGAYSVLLLSMYEKMFEKALPGSLLYTRILKLFHCVSSVVFKRLREPENDSEGFFYLFPSQGSLVRTLQELNNLVLTTFVCLDVFLDATFPTILAKAPSELQGRLQTLKTTVENAFEIPRDTAVDCNTMIFTMKECVESLVELFSISTLNDEMRKRLSLLHDLTSKEIINRISGARYLTSTYFPELESSLLLQTCSSACPTSEIAPVAASAAPVVRVSADLSSTPAASPTVSSARHRSFHSSKDEFDDLKKPKLSTKPSRFRRLAFGLGALTLAGLAAAAASGAPAAISGAPVAPIENNSTLSMHGEGLTQDSSGSIFNSSSVFNSSSSFQLPSLMEASVVGEGVTQGPGTGSSVSVLDSSSFFNSSSSFQLPPLMDDSTVEQKFPELLIDSETKEERATTSRVNVGDIARYETPLDEFAQQYQSNYPWPQDVEVPTNLRDFERLAASETNRERPDLANSPHAFEVVVLTRTLWHVANMHPELTDVMRQRVQNAEQNVPPEERIIEARYRQRVEQLNREDAEARSTREQTEKEEPQKVEPAPQPLYRSSFPWRQPVSDHLQQVEARTAEQVLRSYQYFRDYPEELEVEVLRRMLLYVRSNDPKLAEGMKERLARAQAAVQPREQPVSRYEWNEVTRTYRLRQVWDSATGQWKDLKEDECVEQLQEGQRVLVGEDVYWFVRGALVPYGHSGRVMEFVGNRLTLC